MRCPRCNRNFTFPDNRVQGRGAFVACPHCEFKLSLIPTKRAATDSGLLKLLLVAGFSVVFGFTLGVLYNNNRGTKPVPKPAPAIAVTDEIDKGLHRDLILLGRGHVKRALPSHAAPRFIEGTNPISLVETNDEGKCYLLFGKYIGDNLNGTSGSWQYHVTVCVKPRGEIETLGFEIDGEPADFE